MQKGFFIFDDQQINKAQPVKDLFLSSNAHQFCPIFIHFTLNTAKEPSVLWPYMP